MSAHAWTPISIARWKVSDAIAKARAALLALVTAVACSSHPTPMAAPAGSTITIPVSSEAVQQLEVGYGSTLLAAAGRYDLQRGELRFHLPMPLPQP